MIQKKMLLSLGIMVGSACVLAQKLNHHDLIWCNLAKGTDSLWRPGAPHFLTAFNRQGYNNQPCFFSNNELYFTAQLPEDGEQTDIYALDLLLRTRTRVTQTPTPEYSPTPMPGGRRFSSVRVEADGTQRLWSFPIDRSDNGRPELPNITGVGYHCWLRDTLLALFIVGENNAPHTLQIAGIRGKKPQRVASNIGRCLAALPQGRLAFVQKATEQTWYLKTYDPTKNLSDIVTKMPTGVEDFAMLPDGAILSSMGTQLVQYRPGRDSDWKPLADFAKYGIKSITRIAVSKDGKVAMVVE